MAIYTEKVKDKTTGKMVDKKVDGKTQYYIRTYVTDEFGKKKQITRHNKEWLGRDGYWKAQQEENRLKNNLIYETKDVLYTGFENCPDITFKDLFYLKIENDELHNKNSLSTRLTYEENLRIHVFPIIGDIKMVYLKANDLNKLITHLKSYEIKKGKNKGKKLSPKFINEIIHTTRAVLYFGSEYYNFNKGLIKFLPDIQEDRDKIKYIDPFSLINRHMTLSPAEWEKIAHTMEEMIKEEANEKKKEYLTKIMLFFTTEYILLTRVGETQAMTYKNLLFQFKVYSLYEAYSKRAKKLTPPKNRKARILYIPDTLLNAFERIYEIDSKKENFSKNQFIFGGEKVFPRSTIDRYRKKILERAGVSYLTNHELRHAGISNAIYNEVDVSALSDMAGHDKEIMFKIYLQTLKEANYNLTQTLDKLYVPHF